MEVRKFGRGGYYFMTYGTTGIENVFWGAIAKRWFEPTLAIPLRTAIPVAYAAQTRLLSLMMANIEQSTSEVQVLIFDDLVIVKVMAMGFKDGYRSSYRAGGNWILYLRDKSWSLSNENMRLHSTVISYNLHFRLWDRNYKILQDFGMDESIVTWNMSLDMASFFQQINCIARRERECFHIE